MHTGIFGSHGANVPCHVAGVHRCARVDAWRPSSVVCPVRAMPTSRSPAMKTLVPVGSISFHFSFSLAITDPKFRMMKDQFKEAMAKVFRSVARPVCVCRHNDLSGTSHSS